MGAELQKDYFCPVSGISTNKCPNHATLVGDRAEHSNGGPPIRPCPCGGLDDCPPTINQLGWFGETLGYFV